MRVIMISEEELEKEFSSLLDRLLLEKFLSRNDNNSLEDLYRKFHYELHIFKDTLVKAKL